MFYFHLFTIYLPDRLKLYSSQKNVLNVLNVLCLYLYMYESSEIHTFLLLFPHLVSLLYVSTTDSFYPVTPGSPSNCFQLYPHSYVPLSQCLSKYKIKRCCKVKYLLMSKGHPICYNFISC